MEENLNEYGLNLENLNEQERTKLKPFMEYLDVSKDDKILRVYSRTFKSYIVPKTLRLFWAIFVFLLIYAILSGIFVRFNANEGLNVLNKIIISILILSGVIYLIEFLVGPKFTDGHVYVATETQIIIIRKFIGVMYREIDYKRITDLVLFQKLSGRILNYGTLLPVTAGVEMGIMQSSRLSIEGVMDVFEVRKFIMNKIKEFQERILKKMINEKDKKEIDEI